MKKKSFNAIRLGLFVGAGLILLILGLYILGKNKTFFGNRFELKTQFREVNGLLIGNNVRFSGIDVGSVMKIQIVHDTMIEVTLNVNNNMRNFIRTNSVTSIGTDGLIGNRVVNIAPGSGNAPFVQGGETLPSKELIDTDEMLVTLNKTNKNVGLIAEEVLFTVHQINSSTELSKILNDKTLSVNLRASLEHLRDATHNASVLMSDAVSTLQLASKGDGTISKLLTDTTVYAELRQAVVQVKTLEKSTDRLVRDLNEFVTSLDKDVKQGDGTVNALMRDSVMANQLRATIANAEKGTAAFAADMEALKSNVLFRRHFKKLEKKATKSAKKE